MNDVMTLEDALAQWDGLTESLGELYQQRKTEVHFISHLVSLLDSPALQVAASWLVKRSCEDGFEADATEVEGLIKVAPSLGNWQARLHLLQSLHYLVIPGEVAQALHGFLTSCVLDDNKFIRAWAYQGFITLAEQHPQYQEESETLIARAMQEEAPAIKARLRHRLKR